MKVAIITDLISKMVDTIRFDNWIGESFEKKALQQIYPFSVHGIEILEICSKTLHA